MSKAERQPGSEKIQLNRNIDSGPPPRRPAAPPPRRPAALRPRYFVPMSLPEIDMVVYPDECDAFGHLKQASFLSFVRAGSLGDVAEGAGDGRLYPIEQPEETTARLQSFLETVR
jgi:hypothetical protein